MLVWWQIFIANKIVSIDIVKRKEKCQGWHISGGVGDSLGISWDPGDQGHVLAKLQMLYVSLIHIDSLP